MRIEEEYKKTGYFWLPGKDEKKIPGILSINDGGKIELEIVGHFDESIESLNGGGIRNVNTLIVLALSSEMSSLCWEQGMREMHQNKSCGNSNTCIHEIWN